MDYKNLSNWLLYVVIVFVFIFSIFLMIYDNGERMRTYSHNGTTIITTEDSTLIEIPWEIKYKNYVLIPQDVQLGFNKELDDLVDYVLYENYNNIYMGLLVFSSKGDTLTTKEQLESLTMLNVISICQTNNVTQR